MNQDENNDVGRKHEGGWARRLTQPISWIKNTKILFDRFIGGSNESTLNKPPALHERAAEENDTAKNDRKKIIGNGWKQGAIVASSDEVRTIFRLTDNNCDAYVLVSHSCDVLAYKYKTEPLVELIGGAYSPKGNNSLSHRRHPRQLQLPVTGGEKPYLTLNINHRYFVNRRFLVDVLASDILLSDESLRELQMWMAARYRRTAFPDEFVGRITGALAEIRNELEINGDKGVRSLYVHLDSYEELQKERDYEVVLTGTTEEDLGDSGDASWRAAEDFLEYVAC